jgi:hypothetical protein
VILLFDAVRKIERKKGIFVFGRRLKGRVRER